MALFQDINGLFAGVAGYSALSSIGLRVDPRFSQTLEVRLLVFELPVEAVKGALKINLTEAFKDIDHFDFHGDLECPHCGHAVFDRRSWIESDCDNSIFLFP